MGDRLFHNHTLKLSWDSILETISDYLDADIDDNLSAVRLRFFYDSLFQLICGREGEFSLDLSILTEMVPHLTNKGWFISLFQK